MGKVLFVASVSGHITAFHIPFLRMFREKGYVTEVAAYGEREIPFCDVLHNVCFERNPLKLRNITAYKELKKIINNGEYDIIHCHTPAAAMMTRLAGRKVRKKGTKVIYTAHGFHFFKGAPLLNWLIYFPVEWICSFLTDVLITINKEDYAFAKKHIHTKKIEYVPGVGVDLKKFEAAAADRASKRKELGIPEDAIVVFSVGELNKNKNHETVIRAVAAMQNVYYIVAGKGGLKERLQNLINELGATDRIKLIGYRSDVGELCKTADIFAFPSYREGLPVSVMEAMTCGLPVVAATTRGVTDLVEDEKGGLLFPPEDVKKAAQVIKKLADDEKLRKKMGEYNREAVLPYSIEHVREQMQEIYFGMHL